MSLAHGRSLGFKTNSQKISNSTRAPTPPPLGKLQNEEIQRMNLDLNLLSQKLMDLQNSSTTARPTVSSNTSPFVSSLRDSTSNATLASLGGTETVNFSDLKLQILEKIISKMIELDRFILRSTEPPEETVDGAPRPARRASRGVDLSTFPTHLHLIDRLSDVHAKAQRVAVVVKHGAGAASSATSSNNPPPIPSEVRDKLKSLEAQVTRLTAQLKDSEQGLEMRSKELKQEREASKAAATAALNERKKKEGEIAELAAKMKAQLAEAQKATETQLSQQKAAHEAAVKKLREEHSATMETMSKSAKIVAAAAAAATSAAIVPPATADAQTCFSPARTAPATTAPAEVPAEEPQEPQNDVGKDTTTTTPATGGTTSTNSQIKFIEERLEQEINQKESLIHALLSMATKIQNHCDTTYLSENECQTVCPDVYRALDILQNSVIKRLDELHFEMNSISQHRDLLESEIKTYSLERELVSQDVESLNKQVAKLKEEKTTLEVKCTQQHLETNEMLLKEMEKIKQQNRTLQSDLLASSVQVSYVDSYKEEVARLDTALSTLKGTHQAEMDAIKRRMQVVTDENSSYKKLTEQLKDKIKELCMGTGKDREFLDSFEEVMTEEMMTMKRAFEAKLRMAKEESDDTARRHQLEINRMKEQTLSLSPSAAALQAHYAAAASRRVSTEVGYSSK